MRSRSTRPTLVRLALVASVGVAVALPLVVSPGSAAASTTTGTTTGSTATTVPADAALAAGWLAGERDADGSVQGPFPGTDWGLTIDTLWALRAGGASAADLQRTWGAVSGHVGEIAGPPSWATDKTTRLGGGTAKLLVAAESMGVDPRAVRAAGTSYDVVARTLDLVATTGPQTGRLSDWPRTASDSTNVFSQALAVIGLSRAGVATTAQAPRLRSAVGFLESQQCSPGWFRTFSDDGLTCDAALARGGASGDVDGTAMAVQGLLAARDAGVTLQPRALDAAVAWLASAQHPDGSFGGGAGTTGANANSTGLAAAALQLAGRPSEASRARTWVASLQLTAPTGALAGERGAIAYDATALADARTSSGLATQRDQWRRTTAQAIFALRPVGFAQLAGLPVGTGVPAPPSPPTPPTTPSSPSSPGRPAAPASSSAAAGRAAASSRTSSGALSTAAPAPSAGRGLGALDPAGRASSAVTPGSSSAGGAGRAPASPTPSASVAPASPVSPADASTAPALAVTASRTGATGPVALWRSPLAVAVAVGVLLGLAVVLRPWRLLGGRSR